MEAVKSISRDRFEDMLRSTPVLWERLEKGQANKITEKFISGVRMGFAHAGSKVALSSHPIGLIVLDEVDRFLGNVGGEGDPVILAKARTKNYLDRTILIISSPTVDGVSRVVQSFDEGSMEFYSWPCPHCTDYFVPKLRYLIWPEHTHVADVRQKAHVVCPHCGGVIENKHKTAMNAEGKYVPHRKTEDGHYVVTDKAYSNTHRSYWVSGLCSPWQTFGQLAEEMVTAYRSGDQARIQAVINTYFGETYKVSGESPRVEEVAERSLDYKPRTVPEPGVLTCGVDVQRDGLYYVTRLWGVALESWRIDHGFIAGPSEHPPVWEELYTLLNQGIEGYSVRRALIDSGFRPGQNNWARPESIIYQFCRRSAGRAIPSKGRDVLDFGYFRTSKTNTGNPLLIINTDACKTWLHTRIRWPLDQPGGFWIDNNLSDDYCAQLVSEEVIEKPSGRRYWKQKPRKPNHYLDCEVLNIAAAFSLRLDRLTEKPKKAKNATSTGHSATKNNKIGKKTPHLSRRTSLM